MAIFPLKMRLESRRLFCRFRKTRSILWVHLGSSFVLTKCHTEDGDTGGSPSPRSAHQHWHLCGPWCPKALSRPEVVEPGRGPCFPRTWSCTRPGPSGLCFLHPSPVLGTQPPGPSQEHPETCPRPGVLAPRGPPTPHRKGAPHRPLSSTSVCRSGASAVWTGPCTSVRASPRASSAGRRGRLSLPAGRATARSPAAPSASTGDADGLGRLGWAGRVGGGRRASGRTHGNLRQWGLLPSWAGVLPGPRASAVHGRREWAAWRGQGVHPYGAWGCPEWAGCWSQSLRVWARKGFLSRDAQALCPRRGEQEGR